MCFCFLHAGMVLDVTRWLPEHPGGSSIIPAQARATSPARISAPSLLLHGP
jgi:hypothetical protein